MHIITLRVSLLLVISNICCFIIKCNTINILTRLIHVNCDLFNSTFHFKPMMTYKNNSIMVISFSVIYIYVKFPCDSPYLYYDNLKVINHVISKHMFDFGTILIDNIHIKINNKIQGYILLFMFQFYKGI